MNIRQAYNTWASQYDTNHNKTRDLEGEALRTTLGSIPFETCLEIGCGTGKNTEWLIQKAKQLTAIDLSEEMLAKAKSKIRSGNVEFIHADITTDWDFIHHQYDLVTFSLVLEHIENLEPILQKAADVLKPGGHIYIGELHPFKQYAGSKARFETEQGLHVVECYNHHVSDFTRAAKNHGLTLTAIEEHFDNDDRSEIPRILTLLLQKV
ncbi:class I SAM-dependent methyltransferase [Pontibacter vulgaris]|uniref:class I SAM-dependent methyltransferase n=1 Tax=Pontibacter vulgaris TaxID=2905679 RepID=UPI001FA6ED8B|nr:class I SAM-dependent methyltransferase [Pontibacter vulgaris]